MRDSDTAAPPPVRTLTLTSKRPWGTCRSVTVLVIFLPRSRRTRAPLTNTRTAVSVMPFGRLMRSVKRRWLTHFFVEGSLMTSVALRRGRGSGVALITGRPGRRRR